MTTATPLILKALYSDGKISAYGAARSTIKGTPLSPDELRKADAYWRASLYLCLAMLYLKDNPLLREPLKLEHTKPRLLGHWGSDPGQSFTYTHFNRLIKKYDLNAIFISGPGHGAPAVLSQAYLEGRYSEIYLTRAKTCEECNASSSSSRSLAESAATRLRKHLGASTRGASWVIVSRTPSGRSSTTRT